LGLEWGVKGVLVVTSGTRGVLCASWTKVEILALWLVPASNWLRDCAFARFRIA